MDQELFQNDIERSQHEEAINHLCDEFPQQSLSFLSQPAYSCNCAGMK